MTQEFHISVTPVGGDEYLVRTERVAPGVPLAEEQVTWPVEKWLAQSTQLMNDPLMGLLRGNGSNRIADKKLLRAGDPLNLQDDLSPNLVTLGQQLYSALFRGTIRDSWMTAQGIAQHRREVLRLRLGLKGSRLPRLPWEVLHADNRPLASGTDVVFSRYQPGSGLTSQMAAIAAYELDQPLRILMAIAAPNDQDRLELNHEANHLQEELGYRNSFEGTPGSGELPEIQLTILDQPGREQLTQALEQGQYQVLHYAGHSNLSASGGELFLVNNRTGLTETLSGDDLAGLLVNNGVRMAVFNSCRGAYIAAPSLVDDSGERNLAEALVKRGIPGVLAMAERIPDDVALTLTRLFYRNLKQGYAVDLSVSRARQGLISAYGSDQLYWALPILYLHPEFDGFLTRKSLEASDRSTPDDLLDPIVLLPETYGSSFSTEAATFPTLEAANSLESSETLLEDDITDLVENLEYDDLGYEEDSAVVADLIQQLSRTSPDEEDMAPASSSEILLPDVGQTGLEIYQDLPENPLYRKVSPPAIPTDSSTVTGANVVSGANTASGLNTDGTPVTPVGKFDPSVAAQDGLLNAQVETGKSPALATTHTQAPKSKRGSFLLLVLGVVGMTAIALLGILFLPRGWLDRGPSPNDLLPSEVLDTAPDLEGVDLETASTAEVTAIATTHFNQENLVEGGQAVEELLDRVALSQARTALDAVPEALVDDPAVSFLKGRLAWQSVQVGDEDFSVDDARRYWETAVRGEPDSLLYHNALGFAYYAEGNLDAANQVWLEALELTEQQSSMTEDPEENLQDPTEPELGREETLDDSASDEAQVTPNQEASTVYAGLALSLTELAENQPTTERQSLLSKAAKLYQKVITDDPTNFQPEALSQNWMWTESAIEDWRSLSTLRP